ncbi:hypothetical protein [Petrachloros mirabilis]
MKTARPEYDTDITFHTPRANQGQIVTVSYAAAYPYVICHTHDQSDNTHTWEISKMLEEDKEDYWNGAPPNKRWRKMTSGELASFGLD